MTVYYIILGGSLRTRNRREIIYSRDWHIITTRSRPTQHVLTTVKNILLLSSWQDRWYFDILYRLCLCDCVDFLDAVKKRPLKNAIIDAIKMQNTVSADFQEEVFETKKKLQNKKQSVCVFYRARHTEDVIVQRTVHSGWWRQRHPYGNSISRNEIIIIITIMEKYYYCYCSRLWKQ